MISLESAGALTLLALTDSLSFGTLLVPVWLLLAPGRPRAVRVIAYLGAVAVMYFGIGLALLAGGRALFDAAATLVTSTPALIVRLLAGIALLVVSFALDTKDASARAAERAERSGRLSRWRERAMTDGSVRSLVVLAVSATLLEVASMLPYLAATGVIAAQTTNWLGAGAVLGCYCLVMIGPALVLSVARLVVARAVDKPLRRLDEWLTTHARSTTLWIVGIAGFFLAASAA